MADSELWMVESGAYSDYRVHFVTADKALAEEFVKRKNGGRLEADYDGYRVETIPVYDTAPDWWQDMWLNTSITPGHPPRRKGNPHFSEEFGRKAAEPAAETTVHQAGYDRTVVNITTHGWDHERVEKSHSERVAIEYAKQQGIS